jgi:hypothetical protein
MAEIQQATIKSMLSHWLNMSCRKNCNFITSVLQRQLSVKKNSCVLGHTKVCALTQVFTNSSHILYNLSLKRYAILVVMDSLLHLPYSELLLQVKQNLRNLTVCNAMLCMIQALLNSPHLFVDPYVSLAYSVIYCKADCSSYSVS